MSNPVTEFDFRAPEFRNARVEDYERRRDGKIVRKDRWEEGVRRIAGIVGLSSRSGFEVDDVVEAVADLVRRAAKSGVAPVLRDRSNED